MHILVSNNVKQKSETCKHNQELIDVAEKKRLRKLERNKKLK